MTSSKVMWRAKRIKIILFTLIFVTISTMVMAMGSKQNNWFEQFKKAEDAERELIKLFPKGSDSKKIKTFLEENHAKLFWQKENNHTYVIELTSTKIIKSNWSIILIENNNKINSLKVILQLTGL